MRWTFWFRREKLSRFLFHFWTLFLSVDKFLSYFNLIEFYKVLTFLFPDSFDYEDQVNQIRGFSRFPSVLLCSVWRIPAEYKWDSCQVCGQGEWRTKNKACENWMKNAMLRAPKMCLNYMIKLPGGPDDALLYCVTREILQVGLMFSSRTQAGLKDSFQKRLCLMLLGYLSFSGSAHPVKAEQYSTDGEWQIDFPFSANSSWWVVAIWSSVIGRILWLHWGLTVVSFPGAWARERSDLRQVPAVG